MVEGRLVEDHGKLGDQVVDLNLVDLVEDLLDLEVDLYNLVEGLLALVVVLLVLLVLLSRVDLLVSEPYSIFSLVPQL